MNWNEEHECGNDNGTGERLPRMKAHRGPRSRRATGMMYGMSGAEQPGAVHPAMGPVEPCVVRKKKSKDRQRHVQERKAMHVSVDPRPPAPLPPPRDDARRYAVYDRREQRP